jgi:uncharacterized PurR-regulated membrane protein YhhQ (DUF165 family)
MKDPDKKLAFKIYLYLGALFITSLVISNLIFQKFFYWHPFGDVKIFGAPLFEVSVGILPYPVTFLITDIISEIYGKKKQIKWLLRVYLLRYFHYQLFMFPKLFQQHHGQF